MVPLVSLLASSVTAFPGRSASPWGNWDGNGGLYDGHYCINNDASPPTGFDFTKGYWAGLRWDQTNPAPGVFNFSEVDAILRRANETDTFVEFNALVGQCSPSWLYDDGYVVPLKVNWKPPPTCVPPTCVPAGTWDCGAGGFHCGCDGVYPCNQTFPDYTAPTYLDYLQQWIRATHAHLMALPAALRGRVLSVQVNAGSTGDGTFFHGRLWPAQQGLTPEDGGCYLCTQVDNKTVFHDFYMSVATEYIHTYSAGAATSGQYIPLLFNGYENNDDLVALVNRSALVRDGLGFMIKDGLVSHYYAESGELDVWETSRVMLQSELPGPHRGRFVRSRGESTLTALMDYVLQPAWAAWALAANAAAYGLDTWQNNTLLVDNPRTRPAIQFFSQYAGARDAASASSPGAWAVLRDGLDVADTARWPEQTYGDVADGKCLARCNAIIAAVNQTQTRWPPRLDAPGTKGCGSGRLRGGLNDAGYRVVPGNYHNYLEQIDADTTTVGAWRIGPKDELFGRYGRSLLPGAASILGSGSSGMAFRVTGGVFSGHSGNVFARIVFFRGSAPAAFTLSYSSTASGSTGGKATCVAKPFASTEAANAGHWVELRLTLPASDLGGSGCDGGADIVLSHQQEEMGDTARSERIVFNLVEFAKQKFSFALSPWIEEP
eukprot:g672.t1